MRARLLSLVTLVAALVAAALAPAAATAKPLVGISENNPPMFADPNFTRLEVKTTRLVVAWDTVLAAARGDNELTDRVIPYLNAAQAQGVEVLVAFEHTRGDATVCRGSNVSKLPQCRLPTEDEYYDALRAFLLLRPDVRTIAPWNEANHYTQPTSRNPRRAARFTDAAHDVCEDLRRRCTIVAADLLDAADNPTSRKPTYRHTTKWVKRFRAALGSRRSICGIHNYADVNRFRTSGVKALKKALKCRSYWLTETGGFYDFASFWSRATRKAYKCPSASGCQVKATKFLFKHFTRDRAIKRIYVYTWFGGGQPRFDAGLVEGRPGSPTRPRKAYHVVRKHI